MLQFPIKTKASSERLTSGRAKLCPIFIRSHLRRIVPRIISFWYSISALSRALRQSRLQPYSAVGFWNTPMPWSDAWNEIVSKSDYFRLTVVIPQYSKSGAVIRLLCSRDMCANCARSHCRYFSLTRAFQGMMSASICHACFNGLPGLPRGRSFHRPSLFNSSRST